MRLELHRAPRIRLLVVRSSRASSPRCRRNSDLGLGQRSCSKETAISDLDLSLRSLIHMTFPSFLTRILRSPQAGPLCEISGGPTNTDMAALVAIQIVPERRHRRRLSGPAVLLPVDAGTGTADWNRIGVREYESPYKRTIVKD